MAWPSEQNKGAADTVGKNDGYAQAFTGAGTKFDRSTTTQIKAASLLDEQTLCSMYLADGFARRVVDSVAEEMTRAGICIEGVEEEVQRTVQEKFEELDLNVKLNDALRWSRLFGGSVLLIGANDGGTLEVPLNPEGVKDVEFLRVYDRHQVTIHRRVTDTFSRHYGKPEMYQISPASGGNPYYVHASRLEVFDGESIPERLRFQNEGWGASTLQHCLDQLKRLGMSHQWSNMLLERMQQAVHGIPNLANTLAKPGGDKLIADRVNAVDMVRGILNTIAIDSAETYDVKTQSLTGVNELLDRFAQALSSVSGIPMFVLMGQGKGGLNNTGAAETEAWYAKIGAMQNDILRKPVDKIVSLLGIGEEYTIKFNPLYVPSEKEQAETEASKANARKARADAANVYISMGALDSAEVRKQLITDNEYEHIDATIDAIEPEVEEPEDGKVNANA